MTYNLPTETTINFSQGADRIFVYIASQVPLFIPLMLFSFFSIIFLSGYFNQRRQEGRGDAPQWFTIASFINLTLALILYLIVGLINFTTVSICTGVFTVAIVWFLNTRDNG